MRYENILEQQDELSTKSVKILWQVFQKLDIKIPCSKNTQFDAIDVLRTVLEMSESKKFARSATKKLKTKAYRDSKQSGEKIRVSSDDWALGKLVDMDAEHTKRWCNSIVKSMAKKALKTRMIPRNTMVGIDLTLNPYYGDALQDEMLKTKSKDGTSHFDAYMTTHSIGTGYEIPLSNVRMTKNDKMHTILLKNIKKIARTGLDPILYLLDRGFFSVACILALINAGKEFLMPAPKNARIKKMILQYHKGEINAASLFKMSNAEFGSVSFNLLIVKKDKYRESDPIEDQYVVFATNTPCRTKEELIATLPETYRQRWIVETAFRVIKDVKGKTCSNVLHVRIFLFYFALLLYCLWKFTKYADMLQDFLAGGDDFTMYEFVESVSNSVKELLMWEKSHGNFLEK